VENGFIAPNLSTVGQLDMGSNASLIHWSYISEHTFGVIWDYNVRCAAAKR